MSQVLHRTNSCCNNHKSHEKQVEKYNNNCCSPSHKVKKVRLDHIAWWAERYVQYGTLASTTITMHRVAKCHRYQRYIHVFRLGRISFGEHICVCHSFSQTGNIWILRGNLSLKIYSSFLSDCCAKIGQHFFPSSTLDHNGMVAFTDCRRCHY